MSLPEHISTCPNCGFSPFTSDFCPSCGQEKLTEDDYKISALIGDFVSGFLSLENTFISTFKAFVSQPGNYVQRYNAGARKKYIAPVKWFLLANAFYFLFPAINTFTTTLSIQISNLIYSDLTKGLIQATINHSGWEYAKFESVYNPLTQTLSKALLFVLPLLFGICTKISSLRKSTPLITHFNFSFVMYAFIVFFTASVIPGAYIVIAKMLKSKGMMSLISETNLTAFSLILINIYGLLLYRKLFKSKWWIQTLRWLSLNLVFVVLIYVYRLILLLATLFWMWMFRF